MATDDRVQAPGWWPTKSAPLRSTFVGTSECAKCHEKQALTYINTPMAQASAPTPYSQILHLTEHMSAQRPPYRYELVRSASSVDYSVAEGSDSLSTTLNWAFGLGHKGQTYIYQRNGAFYESRLSFYRTLQGLDLTTGHDTATPDSLESALGRRMDADETRRCFACHTTASTIAHKFDPAHVTPGVTCEACHGPGAKHVVAMKAGRIEDGRRATFDLHRLDPVASVDFCGACHRTWGDVLQGGFTGVVNVRFQPYRLENSKCWGKGDPRLTCVACHDPHQQVAVDPGSYDEKCLACHASASDTASSVPSGRESAAPEKATACPEGTQDCVTCHMPQVELPSIHSPFTDHRIRIVRQDDSYPN
jgi:nitrate/TMAO reductase-like tetraheme cytochrome c subunit